MTLRFFRRICGVASALFGGALIGCATDPLTIGEMLGDACETSGGICAQGNACASGAFAGTESCGGAATCCHTCPSVTKPTCPTGVDPAPTLDGRGCVAGYECSPGDADIDADGGDGGDGGDAGPVDSGAIDAGPVTCAAVGGTCVAVVPGACEAGTINPTASCGGIGATCCIP